jgi:hypothetical protein
MVDTANFQEACMLNRLEFSRDADALFAHVEACWNQARGNAASPQRKDISPARLGRALPFVTLIDVIHGDPIDFQYRLIGQHLILNTGQNLTGKRSLELPATTPTGRPLYEAYVKSATTREGVRIDLDLMNMNGTKRRMQGLVLPLGAPGRPVAGLLGAALFQE